MTSPLTPYYSPIPHHNVVTDLPAPAQVLLAKLYWHRNRETGQCNPRHNTLARELRWSYWKVQAYVRILREASILKAVKGQRGNRYVITPTSQWKRPEREVWERPCRPVQDRSPQPSGYLNGSSVTPEGPCIGDPATAETPRQDRSILYEQETILLKKKSAAADTVVTTRESGGGSSSPAAPEKPKPTAPKPQPQAPPPPQRKPPQRAVTSKPDPVHEPEARNLVDELAPDHPIAGNVIRAIAAIQAVLAAGVPAERIRTSHRQWRKLWEWYRPGRFIPQLWRWIEDEDWQHPPGAQEIAQAKSERQRVLKEEADIAEQNRAYEERKKREAEEQAKRMTPEEIRRREIDRMIWRKQGYAV